MLISMQDGGRVCLLLAAAALSLACAALAQAQNVTVFAAASLKNALDEIDAQYQARGGTKAAISYAASSALAKQIESGAPADIFISADLDWMDYVEKRKLVKAGTRINLLRNEIVLIAPADSKASLHHRPEISAGEAAGRRAARHGRSRQRAGGQVRQGGAGERWKCGRRWRTGSRGRKT